MIRWRFRTYVSPSGRNDVQDFVDALEVDAQVRFAVELKYLAVSPPPEWHEPRARKLRGHKQNVYKPAKALDTADTQRKAVLEGRAGTSPLTIDGEDVPPDEESASAAGLR